MNATASTGLGLRRGYYGPGRDAVVMGGGGWRVRRRDEPLVLGIETSCDETGVGIVRGARRCSPTRWRAASTSTRGSAGSCPRWPPGAPRGDRADGRAGLREAGVRLADVDALAVTAGPGLAGALLVGDAAAKALALALDKPLYGVNHLAAHVAVDQPRARPAARAVPGAAGLRRALLAAARPRHHRRGSSRWAATIDDAAGEAFDKVARLLGLGFPGGPYVDRAARDGDRDAIAFPRGLTGRQGPARAPLRLLLQRPEDRRRAVGRAAASGTGRPSRSPTSRRRSRRRSSTCSSRKAVRRRRERGRRARVIGGGVAANSRLRALAEERCGGSRDHGCASRGRGCAPTTARWSPRSAPSSVRRGVPGQGSTIRPTRPWR